MSRGISPESNNGADLGSESKKWRKLYANSADNNLNLGNNYSLGYRKPNTQYYVGNIVHVANIDNNTKKLVCVKAGTSSSAENLTFTSRVEGELVYDGTVVWAFDRLADGDTAGEHHDGIGFRSGNITEYFESGLLSENLAAGNFVNVYPGDFITKSISVPETTYINKSGTEVTQAAITIDDCQWFVMGINPHSLANDNGEGIPSSRTNHLLMMPREPVQASIAMNPTDDTTGGYIGSDMWRVHMPIWSAAIKNAFGAEHVLKHLEQLTNSVDASAPSGAGSGMTGTATGHIWVEVEANIPNEHMIYGSRVFGSAMDCGEFTSQLPYFASRYYIPTSSKAGWWLRDVASATKFAAATWDGAANSIPASSHGGFEKLRPYFLLY